MSVKSFLLKGFDRKRYFSLRSKYYSTKCRIIKAYLKFLIKRIDNKCCSSIGLPYDEDIFLSPPILVHGIFGIFISKRAKIGSNCTIYQNVNIVTSKNKAPRVGNNVFIGAGAVLIGDIVIGDNVKIGAGAIVAKDIPNNATVVCQHSRIILREETEKTLT